VGVITSLAVFFADQVFHISLPLNQWDSVSIAIGLVAAIALMRFKVSATRVIVACAVAGLVVSYVPWW
jgi:chromate transporter